MREEVLEELSRHAATLRGFGVRRLGLIGSTVRNEARPDSDLDFVVDMADKSYDAYCDTKEFLEEHFGRGVDLAMVRAIKPWWKPYLMQDIQYVEGL